MLSGAGERREESRAIDRSACTIAQSLGLPPGKRYRCAACGNLTRFDVTASRRTTQYWHLDLAGDPRVEEETVHAESVESVVCRWCGRDDAIEVVARNEAGVDPHQHG